MQTTSKIIKCLYFFALSLILTIFPKLGDKEVSVGVRFKKIIKTDFIFGFSDPKLVYMHILCFYLYSLVDLNFDPFCPN